MSHTWAFPRIQWSLPDWVESALPEPSHRFASDAEKMDLAIALARGNIEHGTGGPFGAAVFEVHSGRLVAPGVNLVESLGWSGAHAEMVALAIAQAIVGSFTLGTDRQHSSYELVSSTEPCAMCMGGITWSGISRLVCGASDQDARAIGFDEGVKASDWVERFQARGIAVQLGVCREEAVAVLLAYQARGGLIYNASARPERQR